MTTRVATDATVTSDDSIKIHTTCRACGGHLISALSLGHLYLSGFPEHAECLPPHPRIPLILAVCAGCQLVQLTHTTPWAWMYGGQYWYRSSVNEMMVGELTDVALTALAMFGTKPKVVVDVGANDGTLLGVYPGGVERIAVEPSKSLHAELRDRCDVLIPAAFPTEELSPWAGQVDILTACACLYDFEDPRSFFTSVGRLLSPGGICVVQFQDLLQMIENTAFDVVCHEHLEYYSLWSLLPMIFNAGLTVLAITPRAINGGSVRIVLGREGSRHRQGDTVTPWVAREHEAGLTHTQGTVNALVRMGTRIYTMREQTRATIQAVRDRGGVVDLFAASTKANTLLQVYDLDHSTIRQAIERSPEKVGRFVGATGIPIVSEAEGRMEPAALALVGAWQFREGLIVREAEYLRRGGRLLFPLPRVEIVEEARGE